MQYEIRHLGHWKSKRDPLSDGTKGLEKIPEGPSSNKGGRKRGRNAAYGNGDAGGADGREATMTEFTEVESL